MGNFRVALILSVSTLFLVSCTEKEVLEPVVDSGEIVNVSEEAAQNPRFRKLNDTLKERGYEGVGLAYENDATLDLYYRIFSDLRTANRQISVFYSGVAMAYDAKNRSLTVAGNVSAEMAIAFISKNVPLKTPPTAAPTDKK